MGRLTSWKHWPLLLGAVIVAAAVLAALRISPEEQGYRDALLLSREWYLNNQDDFFLHYTYYPEEDAYSNETHRLREVAALWNVATLANELDDPELRTLAQRGFSSFEKSFEFDSEGRFFYVDITPKSVKLGYSAFIILALLEMEHPRRDNYLDGFAEGILSLQNEDGSFDTHFFSNSTSSTDYYPGEAMTALMALYYHNGDERYLSAVKRAFPYYISYWRGNPTTAFVPWQSRAYSQLHRTVPDTIVGDFVFEMNDWLLERHEPSGECRYFAFDDRRSTVGVYMEGVAEAYALAKRRGDALHVRCYGNYLREGAGFLADMQVKASEHASAVGGFPGADGSMRVDRQQHAVFALLGACDAGAIEC